MFFALSKILYFLLSPLIWAISFTAVAIFTKSKKWKKRGLIIAMAIMLFFSNSFILDEFFRMWEIPATPYENMPVYDYGIVLGGMISYDAELKRMNCMRSIDRLVQAVYLYKKGKIRKIFISGGSGSLMDPEYKEAIYLKQYLIDIGIPASDILGETNSRNTYENAIYTAEVLNEPDKKYLLITSAVHMRRALGCFRKQGIIAAPFSTDRFSGPRKYQFDHLFVPSIGAFSTWMVLLKEYVGYVTYAVTGYI